MESLVSESITALQLSVENINTLGNSLTKCVPDKDKWDDAYSELEDAMALLGTNVIAIRRRRRDLIAAREELPPEPVCKCCNSPAWSPYFTGDSFTGSDDPHPVDERIAAKRADDDERSNANP